MFSGCASAPPKKSSTLPAAPVVRTEVRYVPVQCEVPDPPLPTIPTATSCDDALIEDVAGQTGPWAELMRNYVLLRECVQRHQQKVKP